MIRSTDELVTREFSIVRKGYDPAEVRAYLMGLAAELDAADAADASSGPAPNLALDVAPGPPVAEGSAEQAPWKDAAATIARIVETAHTEAAALVSTAESVATDIRRELQREAEETRVASEKESAAARSAAESDRAEAAAVLAAARIEAERLRSGAEADAASIRRAAAEEGAAEAAALLASTQSEARRMLAVRTEAVARLRRVQNLVSKALEDTGAAGSGVGPGDVPDRPIEEAAAGWE